MTSEEIQEYDGMRAASHIYHSSAVFLQDVSPFIMELAKGKLPVDLKANIITSVFLYALSAEIALKALIKSEGASNLRLHDLKSLFENLNPDIQKSIKDNLISKYPEFDEILERNKNSFIEWRYFYEGATSSDISFLRDFSLELNSQCNSLAESN